MESEFAVYLNGSDDPEIDAELSLLPNDVVTTCFVGGRSDKRFELGGTYR